MSLARTAPLPGYGAPIDIYQPRKPAFWVFAALVAYVVLHFIGDILLLVRQYPTGVAFSLAVYALYTVPLFYLLYNLDLFEREPLRATHAGNPTAEAREGGRVRA